MFMDLRTEEKFLVYTPRTREQVDLSSCLVRNRPHPRGGTVEGVVDPDPRLTTSHRPCHKRGMGLGKWRSSGRLGDPVHVPRVIN